jgi:hypothetical protein
MWQYEKMLEKITPIACNVRYCTVKEIVFLFPNPLKRDSVTRFFPSRFFHESVSPKPLSIPLRPFQIFLKIRGDICSSRLTTGINNTGGKFATSFTSVVDTGGKQWD